MLRYGSHILVALVGLLVQATVLSQVSADALKPDLAFLVVIYLGLHRPMGEATPAVVVIAYLADRFTALPDGTFLLLYITLFYVAGGTSKVFYFRGTSFPALMTAGLSLLYGLAMMVMVHVGREAMTGEPLLGGASFSWSHLFLFAVVNVLFSLVVFRVCRFIDGGRNLRSTYRTTL